ncbi:MAG: AAA family ATPase, partial [Clostridia bacterium]|nr:AAA family ATPase [Clostridia bacterium]
SYLNPGSERFRTSLRSEIYVDKTMLISQVNRRIRTEQKFLCVSRPRRFGKSMAMDMLSAYYNCGEDTSALFENLKIASAESYREHLNKYHVIKINMQEFLSATDSVEAMLAMLKKYISLDLFDQYEETVRFRDEKNFTQVMKDVYAKTNRPFVILIDEWDCLFREYAHNTDAQRKYLDFLRVWLKDQDYVALAYMTGILPIKKYGTHSALNMFTEYSMTDPRELAEYFGFTEDEVKALCEEYEMDFDEARAWYDGYELVTYSKDGNTYHSMYNPKSVVESMLSHKYGTYWNRTETYEALKVYIQMNVDGLKDAVVRMLAGDTVEISTGTFTNDMTTFSGRDDVLTLLVHLGYLTYDSERSTVSIPNKEVSQEYVNAIRTMDWSEVARSVEASRKLLQSLWDMDAEAVAKGIDQAHDEISILQYNDENSLSCTINLAFYFAKEYYTVIRELPTGKGFADICLIPRPLHRDKPAAVIELKKDKDKDAQGAIDQIKQKNYVKALEDYRGNLLLVGINYDKEKKHSCVIEKMEWE